jgi:hypothetical protein
VPSFPHVFGGSPSVPLTLLLPNLETGYSMARYSAFLGRRVEVQYRAGDILLPASGTFVADSGRSIFLEQHFEQRGTMKHFRWEIPYQYIVRIEEKPEPPPEPAGNTSTAPGTAASAASSAASAEARTEPKNASTNSAGGAPGILPLQHRPKTA